MRKNIVNFMIIFVCISVLVACSDKDRLNNESSNNNNPVVNHNTNTLEENTQEENDELTVLLQSIENAEDQLDLSIGDTGSFVTTIGMYDMTVISAELKGYEFKGIESQLDDWILLDITIKNTGDKPLNVEDVIDTMDMVDDLDSSGSMNASGAFDEINDFSGDINPGEEQTAQFIAEVFKADMYYFRKSSGNVAGGSSNQVIWNINLSDMEN